MVKFHKNNAIKSLNISTNFSKTILINITKFILIYCALFQTFSQINFRNGKTIQFRFIKLILTARRFNRKLYTIHSLCSGVHT